MRPIVFAMMLCALGGNLAFYGGFAGTGSRVPVDLIQYLNCSQTP